MRSSVGVLVAAFALLASSAHAASINVWASKSWGWQADGISKLLAAGVLQLPDQPSFATNAGNEIGVSTPNGIPGVNIAKASFTNPSRGSSTWTITANDQSYADLWIVLAGHDITGDRNGPQGNGFYRTPKVGLRIDADDDNWAVVRPAGSSVSYLAYHVGALDQGESFRLPVDYRVAQGLYKVGPRKYLFPQYRVAFLTVAVPEPSTLALLLGAGALLAAARRKSC
jgi:hypothetical protein